MHKKAKQIDPGDKKDIPNPIFTDGKMIKERSEDIMNRITQRVGQYRSLDEKNSARKIKLDKDILEISKSNEEILKEIKLFEERKKTYQKNIADAQSQVEELHKKLIKNAETTNQAAQKVVEAIEQDIKLEKIAKAIFNTVIKITTSLDVSNIITNDDATRVTNLLNTANDIVNITSFNAEKSGKEAKVELDETI